MKILLTGATGFIGARLRRQLIDRGHELICVTRGAAPAGATGCRWLHLDLAGPVVPPAITADAVIYLAQSRRYREFPQAAAEMMAVNATGVLAMLDWARTSGVRAFVYASSANVYASSDAPIAETTIAMPASFYGSSKLIAEMIVESFAAFFQCTVFRLFTVYGPGQSGMLIPSLIDRVRSGTPIDLNGANGLQLSPLFVGDAAHFLERAAADTSATGFQVLNLGGPESLSLREIGRQIGDALGIAATFQELGGRDPGGYVANLAALHSRFGTVPATRFAAGIRETINGG